MRRWSSSARGVEGDIGTRYGAKVIVWHEVCCLFSGGGSPNEVAVVKNKHSLLSPTIFQPEETNYEHRAGDSGVVG